MGAHASATGRWHAGFDRFYGFLGGETNQWYPDLGRGQPLRRAALPARGGLPPLQGPGRQGASRFIRDVKQIAPRQAVVHVVLPGRQPRPAPRAAGVHRQVQGQVRRRLRGLPRVGAAADDRAGHPARGHRADADQPDARGHVHRRSTTCGRGTRSPTTRSALFARMAEVYAGFSRVHRPPGRPDRRLPRGVRAARQHADLLLRRQRRLGRGQPERLGQREQVLQRLARRRSRRTWRMLDELGRPDTYNHYPTGWAMAFSTPFRMFKRYTYQGGVCDPLVIHWPKGIKAQGRGARPVPPRDRHRPDDPRVLRHRVPRHRERLRADAAARASRCATRSTPPTRRRPSGRQYYEMLGTRGIWENGWKAVAVHGPSIGHRPLRRGPLAALPHRRGPLRGARPRRAAARQAQGAGRRSGSPRPRSTTCSRSTTAPCRDPRRARVRRPRCPTERRLRLLPGHGRGARVARRQHARALVQDPRRGRDRRRRRGGRDLRPRLALRRPRAVHQGPQALVRLQLPRHPARAAARRPSRSSPARTCSAWSSPRRRAASTASRTARPSSTSTTKSSPSGADAHAAGALHALRRGPVRSAATPATPSASEYTAPVPVQGRHDPQVEVNVGDDAYIDLERESPRRWRATSFRIERRGDRKPMIAPPPSRPS